jgi:hypothetical protein
MGETLPALCPSAVNITVDDINDIIIMLEPI